MLAGGQGRALLRGWVCARGERRCGALRAGNGDAPGRLRHATAGQGACLPGLNTLAYRPLNFAKYKTVRFFFCKATEPSKCSASGMNVASKRKVNVNQQEHDCQTQNVSAF